MARVKTARGEAEAACAEAERGIARIRRKGIWAWAADLAPMSVAALVRCERHGEADLLVEEFAAGLKGLDVPLAEAALHACRGILLRSRGCGAEAAESFEAARADYAALPRPYSAARAAEAAARCRPDTGDGRRTAVLLVLAEEFAVLGATRDASRCRRVLRDSGVVTPSRRGRRGYGDLLSPREREVARLVALGHTNRAIAEVLFLSPRTVEQHVAKVLRKLGLTSRAEVASLALPDER